MRHEKDIALKGSIMSLNQMMHVVMEETPYLPEPGVTVTMDQLTEAERAEVVAFLAERPIHTVVMAGVFPGNRKRRENERAASFPGPHAAGRVGGGGRRWGAAP